MLPHRRSQVVRSLQAVLLGVQAPTHRVDRIRPRLGFHRVSQRLGRRARCAIRLACQDGREGLGNMGFFGQALL